MKLVFDWGFTESGERFEVNAHGDDLIVMVGEGTGHKRWFGQFVIRGFSAFNGGELDISCEWFGSPQECALYTESRYFIAIAEKRRSMLSQIHQYEKLIEWAESESPVWFDLTKERAKDNELSEFYDLLDRTAYLRIFDSPSTTEGGC